MLNVYAPCSTAIQSRAIESGHEGQDCFKSCPVLYPYFKPYNSIRGIGAGFSL